MHLILLADADSIHAVVTRAAHDVAKLLVVRDLVRRHSHLSTPWNALATLDIRSHGSALTRPHVCPIVHCSLLCGFQNRPHNYLHNTHSGLGFMKEVYELFSTPSQCCLPGMFILVHSRKSGVR